MNFRAALAAAIPEGIRRLAAISAGRIWHWRALAAVGRHLRLHGENWDSVYSLAIITDAAAALGFPRLEELAFRMLMRSQAGHSTYYQRNPDALANVAATTAKAGNWAESIRLMEHSGAIRAIGPLVSDSGAELIAAIALREQTNLHWLSLGPAVHAPILVRTMRATVAGLRWLPGPLADWLFLLPLLTFDVLLLPKMSSLRGLRGDGPSAYLPLRWYRRWCRPVSLPLEPGTVQLLFANEGLLGMVFRATDATHSVESELGLLKDEGLPEKSGSLWVNRDILLALLLRFHDESRLADPADLRAPQTLLWAGGRMIAAALDRLASVVPPSVLMIRASGPVTAMPWSGAWTGDRYLVERFATVVDDGLPQSPATDRAPHLTALAGTSTAMAEEAALVVARARAAGFPASPPAPLTEVALAAALARSTVVHIAAHVQAHPHDPGRGRIQLASGAWIDIASVAGNHHGVELLFLAGCESGVATDTAAANGDDGTAPWRRAGVASVVSTLWRISDRHSPRLADGFYARLLAGESRAEALAGSQRAALRGGGTPSGGERFIEPLGVAPSAGIAPSHPRFWAAFRLTGAGGPITLPIAIGTTVAP